MSEQMKTPRRIWIWPDQDAYGVQNWSKGCYRAEPRRPLDKADGPTGAEYVPAEIMADLYAALERALNFIANTESEMGETLPCGDAARAAIDKARG